jgi:hypothetical protein
MLLKRFADADEKIAMVSRQTPAKVIVTKAATACAEVSFYTISADDVEDNHRAAHDSEGVETTLAQIESDTVPVIERLVRGELPRTAEQRFRMSMFVALQYTRGWRFRQDVNDMGTALARQHLPDLLPREKVAMSLRQQGVPVNDKTVAAYRDEVLQGGWRLQLAQPHAVQQALRFAMEWCLPELLERRWRVLRFDVPLAISDAPVTLWSPSVPGDERASPPGLATARMIILPLDRNTALAMVRADADKIVEAPARRALQINTAVANNAHRWIFHHPDDTPLADVRIDPPAVVTDEIRGVRAHSDGSIGVLHWLVKRPVQGHRTG